MEALPVNEGISMDSSSAMEYSPILEQQANENPDCSQIPDMKHEVNDIDMYTKLEHIISEEVHITKSEDDAAEGSKISPRDQHRISTTSDLELVVSEEVGEESQNDDEAFVSESPDMKHDVCDIDVYMKLEPIISEEVHITKCEDDNAEGSKASLRYQHCISTTCDLELVVTEEVGEESQNDDEAFVSESPDMKHDVSDIDVYMKLEPIISEEVHITKCEDDYAEGSKASPRYQPCISTTSDLELAVSEEVGEESQNDDEAFVSEIPDMKHDVSDIDVYMKLEPIISEEVHITKCEDDYAEGSKSSPRYQRCISTTSDLELAVSEEVGEESQNHDEAFVSEIPDMKHDVSDIDVYMKLEPIISEEVHITKCEDDYAEGSKASPRYQHCISTTSDLELVVSEEVGEESQNDDEAFVSESPDMKHDVCDIDVYMKLEPIISEEVHITKCEDDNAEGSKASLRYQHCISTTCDLELVVTEEVGEESQNDDEAFVSESPDMKHDVSDIDVYMKLEPIISEEVHITKCEDDYAEGSKASPRYQPCISTTSDLELAVSEEVGEESQNDDEAFVSEIPDMKHDVSDIDVYMKLEPIISEEVHITKCEDDYAEGSKSSPRYQRCISTTSDLELAVSEEVGEESQNHDEAFVSEIPDMKHDVSDIDVYMKLEPIISEEVHITKCEDDYAEGSKASPRYQHCISTTSDLELAVSEEVGEESQNDDEAFVSEIPDMKHDVSDIDVYMKLEPIISEEVHITKCEDDYAEGSKASPRYQHCISTTSDLELAVSEEVGEESQNDDEAFVSEIPDMKHDVSDIDVYMKLEPIISEEVHITKCEDDYAEGSKVSPRDQHCISTNCDLEPVIMEEVHEKSEDDDEAFKPSLDRNQLLLTPTDRESTLFIQNSLQQHIQTKKLNNHFECYNCGYTCNKKSKLRSHIFHHKGEKPFKCNVCSFSSNHKNNLEKHVVIHTGEKPFQCSECSCTCNRKSSLKTHILTHSNKKLFKCNVCSYTCKQKSYLEKHVVIHTGEKPFQCNECSYTCNRRSSLKRHILTHSSKKPFECNVCSYTCHQKDYLEKHLVIPTGEKPFQCNERSYTCNRKGSLKRHILTHSSKKLFKCNVCSYTCKRKDHLEKHVVIHTGEKPFQCNECSYTCNRKSSLKTHILTHSSKKLFKCNVCSYTCHQKDYLEKHVVIHTGQKPFQCNECSYTCNRKSSLKRHILTHSSKKLFKCNVCSYTCKRKDHLEKHVVIHTGEKPFECNECSYTCNRKSSLKTHIFTHSSKKPNVMYVAIHVNERII